MALIFLCVPFQAADEFVVQARSTERRWSRALQHEHSLRLQLQDNMVALASQMHGLEDEARQHLLPAFNVMSTAGTGPSMGTSELRNNVSKAPDTPATETTFPNEKELSAEPDGISADESEDDEDKFFDAPEMAAREWSKPDVPSLSFAQKATGNFAVGHRRNISTVSVNDTSFMKPESDADVKEKLPQISSDRRMAVSTDVVRLVHN